jgi:hypothetical protein
MHRNAIDCEVLTGTERNKRILIPRINLTYSGKKYRYKKYETRVLYFIFYFLYQFFISILYT